MEGHLLDRRLSNHCEDDYCSSTECVCPELLCAELEIEYKSSSLAMLAGYSCCLFALEAALWCLLNTKDYKSLLLKAVNLGDDTDTVAAVAGGLAGIYYGLEEIPKEWLSKLQRREYLEEIAADFSIHVE